jgi:hypothetical protein
MSVGATILMSRSSTTRWLIAMEPEKKPEAAAQTVRMSREYAKAA